MEQDIIKEVQWKLSIGKSSDEGSILLLYFSGLKPNQFHQLTCFQPRADHSQHFPFDASHQLSSLQSDHLEEEAERI